MSENKTHTGHITKYNDIERKGNQGMVPAISSSCRPTEQQTQDIKDSLGRRIHETEEVLQDEVSFRAGCDKNDTLLKTYYTMIFYCNH